MGYSIGTGENGRDIGYGVPALCDQPGCDEEIDRGMAYVCGGTPWDENGCHLYFCYEHLHYAENAQGEGSGQLCDVCIVNFKLGEDAWELFAETYDPKPDILQWVEWKLTDESWQRWRDENPEEVKLMRARVAEEKSAL